MLNLKYIVGKLVGKLTQYEMGYDKFKEFICSFLNIDGNKLGVNIKFNLDMKGMSDWYDILDNDSLSIFLCYTFQTPKKYHLFVFVCDKVKGHSAFRSSKESVKDNRSAKFGDEYLEFFGDAKVHVGFV